VRPPHEHCRFFVGFAVTSQINSVRLVLLNVFAEWGPLWIRISDSSSAAPFSFGANFVSQCVAFAASSEGVSGKNARPFETVGLA